MRRIMLVLIAGAAVAGCAADDVSDVAHNRVVRSGAIGAAGGAVAGAGLPGVSAGEGALAGAAIGAVTGALSKDRDRERTAAGYRGEGWREVDESVRNDMAMQDRIMARYDSNRDGVLERGEGQIAERELLRLFDTNRDGRISREEYDRNREYAMRNL